MAKLKYRSPGPKYGMPNTLGHEKTDLRLARAPAYSLGQLLQRKPSLRAPGPKYDLSNITHHGPIKVIGGASSSFRPREHIAFTPGPAAYNTVPCMPVVMPAMPMYSIGIKRETTRKFRLTPAPNAYLKAPTIGNDTPDLPSAPKYTILGRLVHQPGAGGRRIAAFSSPGPARYSAVNVDLFKRQMPRPVMLGRHDQYAVGRGRRTPAPNAYLPGPPSRYANAPQYTIAGRFPDRADPYYTAADKVPDWE